MTSGASHDWLPTAAAIAGALLLVLANALFVAAEFALVRVRPGRLRELSAKGSRRAARALHLVEHLDQALSVCQVGITLASLALGWLGEPAFASIFEFLLGPAEPWLGTVALSASLGLSFLFITFLHVVLGELVPKTVAIVLAEKVALGVSLPLRLFWIASWPLVALLNFSARQILRPFPIGDVEEAEAHGREELRQILRRSLKQGRLGAIDVALLDNIFRFANRRVREIMVPRARVVALDAGKPVAELLERIREEGFSRYPLVEGDLDNVIGMIHVKDLLQPLIAGESRVDLRRLARPCPVVPETLTADRLLRTFQQSRAHLAAVADEYGGTAGIVTLEDVLEELVGELRDEFDLGEQDPIRPRSGGGWVLDPLLPLDRLAELVPEPPPAPPGVHTVAGLMQERLGRLPRAGDRIPFGPGHELVATVVQGTNLLRAELVPRGD